MNGKPTECWDTDPEARAIRIQHAPGKVLILPHDQFLYAESESTASDESLVLTFSSHRVTLRGRCLRRIEIALQRRDLASLLPTPAQFQESMLENVAVITTIDVVEIEHGDARGSFEEPATAAT